MHFSFRFITIPLFYIIRVESLENSKLGFLKIYCNTAVAVA